MNNKIKLCLMLFVEFFKVGLFTIGGGLAMIPLITKICVEDKKWIDEDEMLECVAISQTVPGIIAINTATYIGYKKGGISGAIWATIGVILPSFTIILALTNVLNIISEKDFVRPVLDTAAAITILLKIVVSVLLLFVISMAIVAFTTNM